MSSVSGELVWRLSQTEINDIGTRDVVSETMEACNLKWTVQIGQDERLCVNLVNLPFNCSKVWALLSFHCVENETNKSMVPMFKLDQMKSPLISKRLFTLSKTDDEGTNNNNILTLQFKITILRKYNIFNKITFDGTAFHLAHGDEYQMEWKIGKSNKLGFTKCDIDRYLESHIFYDLFALRIYPKDSPEGNLCIAIAYFNDIKTIQNHQIRIALHCVETGANYSYITSPIFHQYAYGLTTKLMLKEKLSDFGEDMTFKVCITVIEPQQKEIPLIKLNDMTPSDKVLVIEHLARKYYNHYNPTKFVYFDIIRLISSFYPQLNGNTFLWKICSDPVSLRTILKTNRRHTRLFSNVFTAFNLKWTIQLFPRLNLNTISSQPVFRPSVILQNLPSQWKSVTINYRLCVEYKTDDNEMRYFSYTSIHRIDENHIYCDVLAHKYPISQELESIKSLKVFNVYCYMNLLQIVSKKKVKKKKKRRTKIVYQYTDPLRLNEASHFELEWKMNDYEMALMKCAMDSNHHQHFESPMYNGIWCFRLVMDEEYFSLLLVLCSLPPKYQKGITCKVIARADTNKEYYGLNQNTKPIRFTYTKHAYYILTKIPIQDVKDTPSIVFRANVDVLNTHNMNAFMERFF
eukprot:49597_1